MKWTVVFKSPSDNLLAELWTIGPDRADITKAANRIDWLLRHYPLDVGESRDEDVRILVEPPLAVLYTVSEADFLVSVFDVWRWSNPPSTN